jgi:competence protein ComEC
VLRTPLRLVGAVLIGWAIIAIFRVPQPDVLVAADGSAMAVRGHDARLSMVKSGSDTFALREWLAADADARNAKDSMLGAGIRCDDAGCIGRLGDGSLVALPRTIGAFAEDCRRAAVVVSARDAPPGCAALVIDRRVWRRAGAIALRRIGNGFEIVTSRPSGYDRPWAASAEAEGIEGSRAAVDRRVSQSRDATPHQGDLEPGD